MPFNIIRNDITKVHADAIVNTANPKPTYGAGVDFAIYQAAGEAELLAERQQIGEIAPGSCAITGAFRLSAKYIIHTVGPEWLDGSQGEEENLASCYRNTLQLAAEHSCESIAFPLISTGSYGFPKEKALKIAVNEIRSFLLESDMQVFLVVFDEESFALSGRLLGTVEAYIDRNYVGKRKKEEYPYGMRSRVWQSRDLPGEMRKPPQNDVASVASSMTSSADRAAAAPTAGLHPDRAVFDTNRMAAETTAVVEQALEDTTVLMMESGMGKATMPITVGAAPMPGRANSPLPQASAVPKKRRSLKDFLHKREDTFQQYLFRLIDQKGMTDTEVYKRANLDRRLFSKIRSNVKYAPQKSTALALAIALHLNLDDAKDLIGRAGFAFSQSSYFDLIIEYCIENGIYDIYEVNLLLFEYEQPLLGG